MKDANPLFKAVSEGRVSFAAEQNTSVPVFRMSVGTPITGPMTVLVTGTSTTGLRIPTSISGVVFPQKVFSRIFPQESSCFATEEEGQWIFVFSHKGAGRRFSESIFSPFTDSGERGKENKGQL